MAQRENLPLREITASGPRRMIVERDVRAYLARRRADRRVTPLARRVAEEAGLNLDTLPAGTTAGKITRADVEAALSERGPVTAGPPISASAARSGEGAPSLPGASVSSAPPDSSRFARPTGHAPSPSRRVVLSTLRKTIARRMQESHQLTAPVTLTRTVDATELKRLRESILPELAPETVRPTYTDFLVKIVARTLGSHPQINARFDGEDAIEVFGHVDIGLAVDTERGLLVPVLRDAASKGLLDLAQERARLVQTALNGTINPDELSGGNFTITNLGSLGVDAFTPLINLPQIAILGVGRIHPVPAVHDGQITIREQMSLSLTFDHRIVDGAPAARFLQDIVRLIEKPERMWL